MLRIVTTMKINVDTMKIISYNKHVNESEYRQMLNVAPIETTYAIQTSFNNTRLEDFINYVDATEATITTYKRALKQFALFLQVNGITAPVREDIISFREALKLNHQPATVQLYIVAVKQFFKWADLKGLYKNVADHVKGAKITRLHKRDSLTADQVKHIISNMDADTVAEKRDYAIFLLMVTAGLRTIEVSRANLEDLRTLGNYTVLYVQGKGRDDKSEYVKVTAKVEHAIRDYLAVAPTKEPTDALFTSTSNNSKGKRLSTRTLRGIIKDQFIKNGYNSNRLTAHSLRHTTATVNILNGGTLEETQQLLRHQNITTTMIYNHSLKRINNMSEDRITDALFC